MQKPSITREYLGGGYLHLSQDKDLCLFAIAAVLIF